MERSLFAAAVALFLISPAPASAYELNCAAPRFALGDDPRDNNPIIAVDIGYISIDRAWRIFSSSRDGLLASRSEQYIIMDASNDRKTKWQGSLKRNRSLYMICEVKRVENGGVYWDRIYDRNMDNALVAQATAGCAMAAPSLPQPTEQAPMLPANLLSNTLYHKGYWMVSAGASNDGHPLCGMRDDGNNRAFCVKHFKEVSGLTIQFFKDGWAFPRDGIDVPGTIGFGRMDPLLAAGQGWRTNGQASASFLEFDVEPSYSIKFLELRSFREDTELARLINRASSDNIVAAFAKCVVGLGTYSGFDQYNTWGTCNIDLTGDSFRPVFTVNIGVPDHVAISYHTSYCYDEGYGGVASDEVSGATAYSVPVNEVLAINGGSMAVPGTSASYAKNESYRVSETQTDAYIYNNPNLFSDSLTSPFDTISNVTPDVPEPSTWVMMILGFVGLGLMAYRRKYRA